MLLQNILSRLVPKIIMNYAKGHKGNMFLGYIV